MTTTITEIKTINDIAPAAEEKITELKNLKNQELKEELVSEAESFLQSVKTVLEGKNIDNLSLIRKFDTQNNTKHNLAQIIAMAEGYSFQVNSIGKASQQITEKHQVIKDLETAGTNTAAADLARIINYRVTKYMEGIVKNAHDANPKANNPQNQSFVDRINQTWNSLRATRRRLG